MAKLVSQLTMYTYPIQFVNAQKKVKTFTVEHIINAPAEKVWAVVGEDYGAIANSHPAIISSDYVNGTLKAGEGAERVCNFDEKGKQFLKEKQVNYDPKNYTFKNQVYQAGKFPVSPEHTFAIYKVIPIDKNTSKFVFDMTYRTTPAFMGGFVTWNVLPVRTALRRCLLSCGIRLRPSWSSSPIENPATATFLRRAISALHCSCVIFCNSEPLNMIGSFGVGFKRLFFSRFPIR